MRDVSVAPVGAGGGGNVYSPSTWAKQRRSEFKAGQLSHQQSMSVSNMANTVDMDDNERKIVTEFCHYLEKSKQLFNGLRSVTFVAGVRSNCRSVSRSASRTSIYGS